MSKTKELYMSMFPEWNQDMPDLQDDTEMWHLDYEKWQRKEHRLDKIQKIIQHYEEENQRD
jgi:hypothetical protein